MTFLSKLNAPIENTIFSKRPLVLACSVFLTALFLSLFDRSLMIIAVIVFAFFATLFVIAKIKSCPRPLMLMLVFAITLSTILSLNYWKSYDKTMSYISENDDYSIVKATVQKEYYITNYGSAFKVQTVSIDGENIKTNAYLQFDQMVELSVYDTVVFSAQIKSSLENEDNSTVQLLKADSSLLSFTADEVFDVTNEAKSGLNYKVFLLREALIGRLSSVLSGEPLQYMIAILFGERSGLDANFQRNMTAIGVSHVLAVSGMHLTMLSTFLMLFLNRTTSSKKLKIVFVDVVAVFYVMLTNYQVSVMRAAIMLIVSTLSVFFMRNADYITSLFVSGVFIAFTSPQQILSASFLLSFFATLGIVTYGVFFLSLMNRWLKSEYKKFSCFYTAIRYVLGLQAISLFAFLFTAPILFYYFGSTSIIGIVTNLFFVFHSTFSFFLAIFLLFFAGVPIISPFVVLLCNTTYDIAVDFAAFFGMNFDTKISLRYPFVPYVFALFILLFALLHFIKKTKTLHTLLVIITCVSLFTVCHQVYLMQMKNRAEIVYLSLDTSEGFVVVSGNKTLVCDIGKGGKQILQLGSQISEKDYAQTKIEAYMLTHYHTQHINSIVQLLNKYYVNYLYLPEPSSEAEQLTYFTICTEISKYSTQIIMYSRGDTVSFYQIDITTLPYAIPEGSTHPAIALQFSFDDDSLTWIGRCVSASASAYHGNLMVATSGSIIAGSHGTSIGNSDIFYYSTSSTQSIYLPPTHNIDKEKSFVNPIFIDMTPNDEGTIIFIFKYKVRSREQ